MRPKHLSQWATFGLTAVLVSATCLFPIFVRCRCTNFIRWGLRNGPGKATNGRCQQLSLSLSCMRCKWRRFAAVSGN